MRALPSVPSVDVFVAAQGAPPIVLDACDGNAVSGCAAADPDGDSLTYTWTRESGDDGILLQPLDPTDESNRRMVFTPVGKRGWEFRVTANDGLADSVSGRFRVFRSGAFWAGMSQPGQLTRVYPDFLVRDSWRDRFGVLTSFSPDSSTPHVAADGEGRIWLAVIDSSSTLVRMDSSLGIRTAT